MSAPNPFIERAAGMLRANRHLVLATIDEDGPWTAALAFTPFAPNHLFFMSQRESRHGRAITGDKRVSGVIYDSTARSEDVDSIQFAGVTEELPKDPAEVRRILNRSAVLSGGGISEEEGREFIGNPNTGLYRIEVRQAFVLDQEAWETRRVDARLDVDVKEVFQRLEELL
jgi:nitroimidazol reductase NimA-like FMN-containing flavoprotein (pyridoxamine 5'-phosphate oxidase superfamily)